MSSSFQSLLIQASVAMKSQPRAEKAAPANHEALPRSLVLHCQPPPPPLQPSVQGSAVSPPARHTASLSKQCHKMSLTHQVHQEGHYFYMNSNPGIRCYGEEHRTEKLEFCRSALSQVVEIGQKRGSRGRDEKEKM